MKIIRNKWFIAVILLLILAAGGFSVYRARAKAPTEEELDFTSVRKGDFQQIVSASGQVKAQEEIEIRFQTSGRLSWVGVKEGDQVDKWQALASLDKRELKKKLEKDLNNYTKERWDFEQTHDDYDGEVLTDEIRRILDKAQFDLSNKVVDVELTDLALKYATIVSPIPGIVTQVEAPVAGVNITPATAAITVANPNSVVFVMTVDEADISQVKVGQTVEVSLDAYEDQVMTGKIARIGFDAVSDSGGTAYPVDISLPGNDDLRFRLGMNGEGEIITEQEKNVLLLVEEAVAKRGEEYFVYVAKEGRLHKTDIEVARWGEDEVIIASGLKEDDKVVSSNISKVKDGQKI